MFYGIRYENSQHTYGILLYDNMNVAKNIYVMMNNIDKMSKDYKNQCSIIKKKATGNVKRIKGRYIFKNQMIPSFMYRTKENGMQVVIVDDLKFVGNCIKLAA